jgi:hypothetical protein
VARVAVLILHPEPGAGAGPLVRSLAEARRALAEVHRRGFMAAGADEATVVAGPPDDTPFGARLGMLAGALEPGSGLVVLGSGALPLASAADRRAFVAVAASGKARALANVRYSADVVAVGRTEALAGLPALEADNALPRWLEEVAGVAVHDLRARWRLAIDLDSPLDIVLAARDRRCPAALRAVDAAIAGPATARLDDLAARFAERRAEVLVAGGLGRDARWLEGAAARASGRS